MLQLTYISTAKPGMTEAMVGDILTVSRWNNAAAGVTGLLLYDGHRFLQALEGQPEEVLATFTRVKSDPRHRAVVLLAQAEVETRTFGDWAMAAQRVGVATGNSLADLVDDLTERVKDPNMQATFRSFARVRTRLAA